MVTHADINKLKEALQLIHSECKFHNSSGSPTCSACPLSPDGFACGIVGTNVHHGDNWKKAPNNWKLLYDVRLFTKEEK